MANQRVLGVSVALLVLMGCFHQAGADDGLRFVEAVRTFADNVLQHGRDVYGPTRTPLFVDGIDVETHAPAVWKHKGRTWIICNVASQQNLFRTLDGLSSITGDEKYRLAAAHAMKYAFEHLKSPNGLIHWGGHTIYDAGSETVVGEGYKHELKYNLPYYQFMWRIDRQATRRFIEAFWGSHILNWATLDMNRHGKYDNHALKVWANKYVGGPVFFEGKGLPFLSTGTDLIYSAAILAKLTNDAAPLVWAKLLAHRYVETRNPKTHMGGIQYTRYRHGDRAFVQFGDQFPGHLVLEGTLVIPRSVNTITGLSAICRLKLSELLGPPGRQFRQWAIEDLKAFAAHAYDAENKRWMPMLTDGHSIDGFKLTRDGYYRPDQKNFEPWTPLSRAFWSYALAWRISGDEQLWEMARNIGRRHGLGNIGDPGGASAKLNPKKNHSRNANLLLGLLELYGKTKNKAYLTMATRIGDNILKHKFHKGLFVHSKRHIYAKFDTPEPLVLLHLVAALRGRQPGPWQYWGSQSFFHCPYDGAGRTYDNSVIYTRKLPEDQ